MSELPPALLERVRAILDADRDAEALLLGEAAAAAADRDAGFHDPAAPAAVALPTSTAQVAALVAACADARVPIVPRGAGSGLEGGCVAYSGGLVLDTSRLKGVAVNRADMCATVGAGVRKLELNKALAPHGLLFGPDPSSNPSLGGMASTAGSGMTTLAYGTTRENVLSLVVVTPQGRTIRTRPAVRKASTGYELTQLYCGSEGTLGIITELTVRVRPVPPLRSGGVAAFRSVRDASAAVLAVLNAGLGSLLRCELLNAEGIAVTNEVYGTALPRAPTLFLEFAGGDAAAIARDADAAGRAAAQHGADGWRLAADGAALDALWDARRGCYLAAARYRHKKGERVYVTDVCVPLSAVPAIVAETERDFETAGFPCVICAHIADGNFHCLIPYQRDELPRLKEVEGRLIDRALAAGGACSGEHGVGTGKIMHCVKEHGHEHIDIQRRIKAALDPLNIMNPGKMLPPAPGGGATSRL